MTAAPRRAGFTLLELLIAIAILGLLATILFGGLQFGTRVWKVGDRSLERFAEVQTAYELIRRSLERAVPLPSANPTDEAANQDVVFFEGTPQGMRFLGLPPASSIPGEVYQVVVAAVGGTHHKQLVFAMEPLRPLVDTRRLSENLRFVLLDDTQDIRFAYFGDSPEGDRKAWLPQWEDGQGLPQLISIQVEFPPGDSRVWPQLIVSPLLSPPGT